MKFNFVFALIFGFCLLSITAAFSQRQLLTGLKVELGAAGLLNESDHTTPGFLEEKTTFKPGIAVAAGVTGLFYFGQKKVFGISLESMAGYASFTKENSSVPQHESGLETIFLQQYRFCNLALPVKLNYRHKKLTIFAGVIPTWHVYGRTTQYLRWRTLSPPAEFSEAKGETIEVWLTNRGDKRRIVRGKFFEKIFNLQAVAGLEWELNKSLSLGLEYANFVMPNKIVRVFTAVDVTDIVEHYFKYNSLTVSLKWWMKSQEKD